MEEEVSSRTVIDHHERVPELSGGGYGKRLRGPEESLGSPSSAHHEAVGRCIMFVVTTTSARHARRRAACARFHRCFYNKITSRSYASLSPDVTEIHQSINSSIEVHLQTITPSNKRLATYHQHTTNRRHVPHHHRPLHAHLLHGTSPPQIRR